MESISDDVEEGSLLYLGGKITDKLRKSSEVNRDATEIHEVLDASTKQDQLERDVAMVYGLCKENGNAAKLVSNLFKLIRAGGLAYRTRANIWKCFGSDFPYVPLASVLCHGGRIMIQLPKSTSRARVYGNTAYRFVKGVAKTPFKLFNKHSYKTSKTGHNTAVDVVAHVGLSAGRTLGSPFSAGWRAYDAGDNKIWNAFASKYIHKREFASHSTVERTEAEAAKMPPFLPHNRLILWQEQ